VYDIVIKTTLGGIETEVVTKNKVEIRVDSNSTIRLFGDDFLGTLVKDIYLTMDLINIQGILNKQFQIEIHKFRIFTLLDLFPIREDVTNFLLVYESLGANIGVDSYHNENFSRDLFKEIYNYDKYLYKLEHYVNDIKLYGEYARNYMDRFSIDSNDLIDFIKSTYEDDEYEDGELSEFSVLHKIEYGKLYMYDKSEGLLIEPNNRYVRLDKDDQEKIDPYLSLVRKEIR
jgi:hypothetical protein